MVVIQVRVAAHDYCRILCPATGILPKVSMLSRPNLVRGRVRLPYSSADSVCGGPNRKEDQIWCKLPDGDTWIPSLYYPPGFPSVLFWMQLSTDVIGRYLLRLYFSSIKFQDPFPRNTERLAQRPLLRRGRVAGWKWACLR